MQVTRSMRGASAAAASTKGFVSLDSANDVFSQFHQRLPCHAFAASSVAISSDAASQSMSSRCGSDPKWWPCSGSTLALLKFSYCHLLGRRAGLGAQDPSID